MGELMRYSDLLDVADNLKFSEDYCRDNPECRLVAEVAVTMCGQTIRLHVYADSTTYYINGIHQPGWRIGEASNERFSEEETAIRCAREALYSAACMAPQEIVVERKG